MYIDRIEIGVMSVNCYLIGCEETKEALLIDPGEDPDWILDTVKRGNWDVKYIINTHCHYDHIGANKAIKEALDIEILIHPEDAPRLIDPQLNLSAFVGKNFDGPGADGHLTEGDMVEIGKTVKLKVLHTPGHTPGSISLYQTGHLFSGDTLFAYGIGRTDLPGGSADTLMDSIQQKLLVLPDDTRVYPGHNVLSSIGEIKKNNQFVK